MFVQLLKLFFREHSFTMRSEQSMNNPLFIVIKHIVLSIHQIISSLVLRIQNLIIQNPLLFRTCFDQVLWEVLSYSCVPYLGPLLCLFGSMQFMSSRFPRNSETYASEFLENLEEMFPGNR